MSKRSIAPLIWGGLLIILGLLLLVENLGWLGSLKTPFWSLVLGAMGAFFLVAYVSDRKQWWALIPGLVLLGIAAAIFLAEQEIVADYVVAAIILIAIALPFLLIFLTDRQHFWALIPAFTMAGIASGVFLEGAGAIDGTALAGFVMGGISLGFASIYVVDRQHWWALIPGGILGLMAIFFLMAAAAKFILPLVIILFGLLFLMRAMRGGRQRVQSTDYTAPPSPPEAVEPRRKLTPTLEEQIEAAISDAPDANGDPS